MVLGQSTLVLLHSCRSTAKWAWKSHLHARWLLATRFVVEVIIERESGGRGGVFNSPRANSNVRCTLYMSQYSIGAALYCTTLSSILLGVQQCTTVYTEQFTLQQYRLESKTLQCSGGEREGTIFEEKLPGLIVMCLSRAVQCSAVKLWSALQCSALVSYIRD